MDLKRNVRQNNKKSANSGLTFIEVMFGVAVGIIIAVAAAGFSNKIFTSGKYLETSMKAEDSAKLVMRDLVSEIRSMNYSAVGGYMIETAFADSFIFYSDITGDGNPERLRYFLDGDKFKKGVVHPTGSPLSYNNATEEISVVVPGVVIGSSIFSYYDEDYNGSGEALSLPANILDIRLVKVSIPLDIDGTIRTLPYNIESQVAIRNLKQNL